jgi:putative colanic acid biosynthesis acetyltransferase WcaF
MALWNVVWLLLFRGTPKFLSSWRVWLLRLFGCQVKGRPFVAASVIIKMPWNLSLADRACLGDRVEVYNLGPVILKARCTVAQHTYLCAGTHDLSLLSLPLVVGPIVIGEDAFIGARALILAGVTIGAGAVVGAGAGVFKDVEPWTIVGGNPARYIKPRIMRAEASKVEE